MLDCVLWQTRTSTSRDQASDHVKIMATRELKPCGCPVCGACAVAEIVYGLPAYDDALGRALDAGHVVLGGCCVSDTMPQWRCRKCQHEWGTIAFGEADNLNG